MATVRSIAITNLCDGDPAALHGVACALSTGQTVTLFSYVGPADLFIATELQGMVGQDSDRVESALSVMYWRNEQARNGHLGL